MARNPWKSKKTKPTPGRTGLILHDGQIIDFGIKSQDIEYLAKQRGYRSVAQMVEKALEIIAIWNDREKEGYQVSLTFEKEGQPTAKIPLKSLIGE